MESPSITLYTATPCRYCRAAKALLNSKNINFIEIDISHDDEKRQWLFEQTGKRSVPIIFVNETPLGGFDELQELEKNGQLDDILKGKK